MKTAFTASLIFVLTLHSATIHGQSEATPSSLDTGTSLRVFSLEKALPQGVLSVIKELYGKKGVRAAADPRTHSIVVHGPELLVQQIAELVERLDIPPRGSSSADTVIIQPRHRPVDEFHELVAMHMARGGRWVIDASQNAIIVQDTPESVSRLRGAVNKMDAKSDPPSTVFLEFLILQPGGSELPPQDASVGAELERLGLADFGVHRRVMIKVLEGSRFSVAKDGAQHSLQLSGNVHLEKDSGAAAVALKVEINSSGNQVSFSTSLQVPLNDHVLVGLAPSVTEEKRHIVLALKASF